MVLSEKEKTVYSGRGHTSAASNKTHQLCLRRLRHSVDKSPYVKYMLDAMRSLGCEVNIDKHLVCEPCSGQVSGGFDAEAKQIVLCENMIYSQGLMTDTLTHELIHAFDYCRADIDFNNLDHIACTEIRAANLSGECFFWKETFTRLRFGWKKHQQKCVKDRAIRSILCVQDVSFDEARARVEKVFDTCFRDTVPFERVPP